MRTTVTIPAGSSTVTLTITPIDDDAIEGAESVVVVLAEDPAYVIGTPAIASATIEDNDFPLVTVSAVDAAASEAGPNTGAFRFTRTGSSAQGLTVSYTVSGNAANDGSDFLPQLSGTLNFAAGELTA